jgi:hypothetical protein
MVKFAQQIGERRTLNKYFFVNANFRKNVVLCMIADSLEAICVIKVLANLVF